MPVALRRTALLLALATATALAGCGGSSGGGSGTTPEAAGPGQDTTTPAANEALYVRQAEAICRRSVAKTRALGRRLPEIVTSAPSPQQGITNGLVKAGTAILSKEAADLRSLGEPPDSPALETYLGLFEPIVELARQRIQAGVAGDPERAHQLELIIANLGKEQSAAARSFGLRECSIEFNTALGGSG
jgi:hypothetical protein